MGFHPTGVARWESTMDVDFSLLVPVTADVNGPSNAGIEIGDRCTLRLDLDITAASGTSPTLDVIIQTSKDGVTWRTLGTFAQKTAISSERKCFAGADKFVRAVFDVGGTSPSFTCTLKGQALA